MVIKTCEFNLTCTRGYRFKYVVPLIGMLNQTTNLLVLLIVTSLFLPATAIMYASGSLENSSESVSLQSNNTVTNNTASNNTGNAQALLAKAVLNGTSQGVDLDQSVLAVHNHERALVGVSPLTWNDTLAAGAQTWVDQIATTGEFAHSQCSGCYGENLAARNHTTAVPMAQELAGWVSEKNNYHGGPFDPTTQTNSSNVYAHYTQMVWNNTTEIGCATDSGGGVDYLVCRYTPPGNIVGQQPY
jgi:uncharacterized protein YkwD